MPASRPPARFAHTSGYTDITYADDGKFILTSGSEGDIRIWTSPAIDNQSDKCVGDVVFAIAQNKNRIYVGADNNSVQIFTYPEGELNGVLTRFTAPVTDLSISPDGKFVAASSRDMEIHICNVATGSVAIIIGHSAPVLSVAMDPRHEFVVSSSCDGSVRIWNVADQSLVKQWDDVVPPCKSFTLSRTLCRMSWQPVKGFLLAVPFSEEIHVFDRKIWDRKYVITSPATASQIFSICSWSFDDQFLAASTVAGDVLFWSLKKMKVTEVCSQKKKCSTVCALAWNPDVERKEIAYSDSDGHFGLISNCCSEDVTPVADIYEAEVLKSGSRQNEGLMNGKRKDELEKESLDDLFSEPLVFDGENDDDDDDDDNNVSIDKIKSQHPLEDLDDDDLSLKDAPVIGERSESRVSSISGVEKPPFYNVQLQAPFQPSSTPRHLNHRFMLWNDIGVVYQYNADDENSIQVEFHDAEFHYQFRIENILGHHIAALSHQALVLACESQNEIPSKLVCVLLKGWDGSKEWSAELPDKEEAVCVAAGDNWVAVATDARILRVFTLSGSQKQVISLPGPTICMASLKSKLIVVYHCGVSILDDQVLSYSVYSMDRLYSRVISQPLPLAPKSELRWLGFTDEGSICATDSSGMLRIHVNSSVWQPICNLDSQTKNKLDHYFVIGVSETFKNIRCLLCKGAIYPRTTPKPIVAEISWKIPLCDADVEKGQLEDKLQQLILIQQNLRSMQDDADTFKDTLKGIHKDILSTGLKLFAIFCRNDWDMRALEICEMVDDVTFLQLAIKYVESKGKSTLIDHLSKLNPSSRNRERPSSPHPRFGSSSLSSARKEPLTESLPMNHSTKNDASQDVFGEDNFESQEENLILVHKKRKATENLSSSVFSASAKGFNPFKKKVSNVDSKGLDALDSSTMKLEPVKENILSFDQKLSARKMKKDTVKGKVDKKASFLEWFETEKPKLQEEFPNLDSSDLTKTAMKRFKSLKSDSQSNISSPNLASEVGSLKSFFSPTPNPSTPLEESTNVTPLKDMNET